jgi:hypothetical protein
VRDGRVNRSYIHIEPGGLETSLALGGQLGEKQGRLSLCKEYELFCVKALPRMRSRAAKAREG